MGQALPPIVFPRVYFKEHFIRDGPAGCIGTAHPSGWMTANNFLETFCETITSPVLLLLDNHDSHLSIEVLDYAKENGVVMLSFPPHCSHMMQPLDRMVYGAFKKFYNSALKAWLMDHPGRPVGIYDVPGLGAQAFPKAMTPANVLSGFCVTGTFPHDRNIFPSESFLPSQVTDRDDPNVPESSTEVSEPVASAATNLSDAAPVLGVSQSQEELPSASEESAPVAEDIGKQSCMSTSHQLPPGPVSQSSSEAQPLSEVSQSPQVSAPEPPISATPSEITAGDSERLLSPEDIRPFPRAPPRKVSAKRAGSCRILTDTPVKNEIAQKKQKQAEKKRRHRPADTTAKPCKRLNFSTSDCETHTARQHSKKLKASNIVPDTNSNATRLYCDGLFLESRNEFRPWIMCEGKCKKWAHRVCAGKDKKDRHFVCEFCG